MKTYCYLFFIYSLVFLNPSRAEIEEVFKKVEGKTEIPKMKNIDYIYLINLDKRPEKYKKTIDQLAPYGICPYRFSAVNGWELKFEDIDKIGVKFLANMSNGPIASVYRWDEGKEYHSHEIMKEVGITYFCHGLSRGAMGCFLSHLSLLQDAYDSGYNVVWILEDDIKVISNPHELSSLIDILNNEDPFWDVLFTDTGYKNSEGKIVPCTSIRPRPNLQLKKLAFYLKDTPITQDLTKIGMRFASHSMIVSRAGMKKILDYIKKYKIFYPYDIEYAYIPGIRLYNCNRDIVTNMVGASSDNGSPNYN